MSYAPLPFNFGGEQNPRSKMDLIVGATNSAYTRSYLLSPHLRPDLLPSPRSLRELFVLFLCAEALGEESAVVLFSPRMPDFMDSTQLLLSC